MTDTRTITLVSGDRVVVDDKGAFVRTEGRTGMSFTRYVTDGHQYVVPDDALPLLKTDRIDRRFFDITALLDFGYEDAKIDRIPVRGNGMSKADAVQQWGKLLETDDKIWLDGKAKLTLDQSVPLVNAPQAWQRGFDGTGVTVAVLDTGYDQGHPELKNVVASKDFTGLGIQDTNGHGTHVASTVAGRSDRYSGVAKGANLAIGRVCEDFGCLESAIIAGMEWAARDVGAKVISMSLGGDQSDGTDPLSQTVERLTAETGALFVIAAGNDGQFRKVSAPAAASSALAVANVTKQSTLNEMSSRGPRFGDHAVKPDLAAPGTDIVAARAKDTLGEHAVDELHARLTGTSMATPHVAGAAAILRQQHPQWSAQELKTQLMASARQLPGMTPDGPGAGLLDLARATAQQVRTDTASLSYGLKEWPHTTTDSRTITYRNDGDAPVTLSLALPLQDFSLSESTITVPAHGTKTVTVTLDPRLGVGKFYGYLTATGPDLTITTPVGAYVQEERHKLSVKITGRDGRPAGGEYLVLTNLSTGEGAVLGLDANGVGETKLPVADYAVLTRVDQRDANPYWYAPMSVTDAAGRVSMTKDAELHLDARQGKPIKVDVGDPRVAQLHREVDLSVPMAPGKISGVSGPVSGDTDVYGLRFGDPLPQLEYDTLLKAAKPKVEVSAGFPVGLYESSPPVAGKRDYRVVGMPSDDYRGALVLLQLNGTEPEGLDTIVARLKGQGAAAVLQVGPLPFGTDQQTALPVLWASQHRAADLVKQVSEGRPVTLTVTGTETSPVSYNLFYAERGTLPAGKTYPRGPVAEVKARYHSSGDDHLVRQRLYPILDGGRPKHGLLDEWLLAPATRTEYFSAGNGLSWYREGITGRMFGGDARDPLVGVWSDPAPVRFRPGQKTQRDWNAGVAAPAFGVPASDHGQWASSTATRAGDMINAKLSAFTVGGANESWIRTGWGALSLSRNGEQLGSTLDPWNGSWSVPAGKGRFELTQTADRGAPQLALSTHVETKWGFDSAAAGVLPLLQVRYDVPLDLRNSVRAGAPLPVKFTVTRQPGAGKAKVRDVKAWASHDDGATWVPVKSIIPPGGKPGGFVSLRVTATDTEGNTIDQTVLRAFRLRA